MMHRRANFTMGWIDTTIHDFLAEIDEPSSSMAYVLVTCLDSSFDVASIAAKNPPFAEAGKIVGKGILTTTRRLLAAERRNRLFFGFDEIWFFPHGRATPKPKNLLLTGPNKIVAGSAKALTKWMRENGCSLGLGDGVGMNFCAKLQGVAKFLVESYAESDAYGSKRTRAIA